MALCRLPTIRWDRELSVGWGGGAAGGESGRTNTVAVAVVVAVDAIFVAGGCCSCRIEVKLTRYGSGDRDRRYRDWVVGSSFGGVGGLLIFS
jgi:hypothetical protein